MVTRDTAWESGTPCWVDLGVDNIDKAVAFYSDLLGWDVQRGGEDVGGYSMALVGGKAVAGIGPKMMEGQPTVWMTYLGTDDLDATLGKVGPAGGSVLAPAMDVMDFGRMAIVTDPGGAAVGLWQSKAHTGFGRSGEPGTVAWNENFSRDFDRNKTFYQQVFGYEYGDMSNADMQYATFKVNGRDVGGIGAMGSQFPKEVPANWGTYFQVQNTDDAVAKVTSLRGKVIAPPFDTPFGRMATVADDQGAPFSLMSAPAS